MTCTHHVPVITCVYNSHEFKLCEKSINMSFDGFWASYSHGRSRVFQEVKNWLFFPSFHWRIPFYIILHLLPPNLAEASDSKPLHSFFVLTFSSAEPSAERFLIALPALLEKRTLANISLYHILITVFGLNKCLTEADVSANWRVIYVPTERLLEQHISFQQLDTSACNIKHSASSPSEFPK